MGSGGKELSGEAVLRGGGRQWGARQAGEALPLAGTSII